MRMSNQEFRNEYLYGVTMGHIRGMLEKGLITEEEYREANDRMLKKYSPVSAGLISESDLLYRRSRANMGAGKEAGNVENQKD